MTSRLRSRLSAASISITIILLFIFLYNFFLPAWTDPKPTPTPPLIRRLPTPSPPPPHYHVPASPSCTLDQFLVPPEFEYESVHLRQAALEQKEWERAQREGVRRREWWKVWRVAQTLWEDLVDWVEGEDDLEEAELEEDEKMWKERECKVTVEQVLEEYYGREDVVAELVKKALEGLSGLICVNLGTFVQRLVKLCISSHPIPSTADTNSNEQTDDPLMPLFKAIIRDFNTVRVNGSRSLECPLREDCVDPRIPVSSSVERLLTIINDKKILANAVYSVALIRVTRPSHLHLHLIIPTDTDVHRLSAISGTAANKLVMAGMVHDLYRVAAEAVTWCGGRNFSGLYNCIMRFIRRF